MLGGISVGCSIGAVILIVDGFTEDREFTTVSPTIEISFGFLMLCLAICCAVLRRVLNDDDF